MNSVRTRASTRMPPAPVSVGLFLLFALLLPVAVQAQMGPLEHAKGVYRDGDFDEAIQLFVEIYEDSAQPKEAKKEALHYLGRAYIARSEYEEARKTVAALLELEPPLVELDPDVEPPPLMDLYYELRTELEGYTVQTPQPGMKTLAIMDFTNSSVDDHERLEPLEQGFASMMINYLSGATDLKVIERERIQWLLEELEMQRDPDLIDQATAVETGKLMGANAVLFGAFTMHRKQLWMSARLVDVETGEILLAEQIFGKSDDFFESIQDLSMKVVQAINVTMEESDLGVRTETHSLDAMISYSEGLKLLERGDYRAAYEKFNEAVAYDPSYTRAKLKAESIMPMLAAR